MPAKACWDTHRGTQYPSRAPGDSQATRGQAAVHDRGAAGRLWQWQRRGCRLCSPWISLMPVPGAHQGARRGASRELPASQERRNTPEAIAGPALEPGENTLQLHGTATCFATCKFPPDSEQTWSSLGRTHAWGRPMSTPPPPRGIERICSAHPSTQTQPSDSQQSPRS